MEYDPSSTPLPEAAASGAVQQAPTGPGRTPSPPAREKTSPYRTVRREDLILRDVLAADRTVLANERTLLAYARTALACFGGGAGLVHFIEAGWSQAAGWALIVVAPVITAFGVYRYLQVRRDMAPLRDARNEPIDSDKRDA